MSLKDLIAAAFNKDATSFESAFSSIMKERVASAIDSRFLAREEYELDEAKEEDDEDEDEEDDDSEDDDEDEKGMKEEVDQIDEISGAKLGTYMIKARKSEAELDKKRDDSYDKPNTPENKAERKVISRTLNKRRWGHGKALDKLTGSSFAKVPATEK
jgi:hypothetical protein